MTAYTYEGHIIEQTLRIADKRAKDVDFILNAAQTELDNKINQIIKKRWPVRLWVPKARREGVSAYVLGRFLVKCIGMRNRSARIVAHNTTATQKLLGRIKYHIKHMKGAVPELHYNTRNEISFPETDSAISIYTAGSPEAARSDTITDLHCSEIAFWDDPKAMSASLFECVPDNTDCEIIVESTGNGAETWYHRSCTRAMNDDYESQLHFLPWNTFPEYTVPYNKKQHGFPLDLKFEFEEPELIKMFPSITPGQLLWRRMKISRMDMDIDLFKQEYPMILSECFMMAETSFFHKVILIKTPLWKRHDKHTFVLDGHPNYDYHYILGADVSAGVKQDKSVVEMYCVETGEQVLEYASNTVAPNDFAAVIEFFGMLFGWPFVVIEANNYGVTTLDNLRTRRIYPWHRVYKDRRKSKNIAHAGFHTTRAKPLFLGHLRRTYAVGKWILHSAEHYGECNTFTGDLKAEEGCFDDRVMASAMCEVGMEILPNIIASERAPITINAEEDRLKNPFAHLMSGPRYTGQPISSQASVLPY